MIEAMVAAGLREPVFVPEAFFRAIFHCSPEFALKEREEGSEKGSVELVERLAENQKKMLELIIRDPRISKKAMAETIGISTTALDKHLAKLKRIGILRRVGPDRGGYWEVVHKERRDSSEKTSE
jgi:ATP-dependent DNA helicase RecG